MARCWCGSAELHLFSPDYLECPHCDTLVRRAFPTEDLAHVRDAGEVYSRDYFLEYHHAAYGGPDFYTRTRGDLTERALYWLRTLLQYRLPPGKVLELGSAHGGFVALLRSAGFDAAGLELSPWVVDFARRTFDVPVLLGPIEDQELAPASFDAIALMDVLEHLADPVDTLRHCLDALKPDGLLLLQTPCRPESKTYAELQASGDRFVEHLRVREHLYLFSENGLRLFFAALGASHVVFEPALFDYDMFAAISRMPLARRPAAEIARALEASPGGRLVQALFDLADQEAVARRRAGEVEADADARLATVERVGRQLAEAEADRAARLQRIDELEGRLAAAEADRATRLATIEQLGAQLVESEADRAARLENIHRLSSDLVDVRQRLAAAEAERDYLRLAVESAQAALDSIRRSRGYRLMRRLGRWGQLDRLLAQAIPPPGAAPAPIASGDPAPAAGASTRDPRRIAVDLTPLLPGGENGGAKLMTVGLVQHLSRLLPDCELVLLTADVSHDELASLDAPNVRRLCVRQHAAPTNPRLSRRRRLRIQAREQLTAVLPPRAMALLKRAYRRLAHRPRPSPLLRQLDADLLFCPFTAPFFFDPAVPTVSVVYDLQHRYYPQFFSADDRYYRDRHLAEAARLADRLVCISEHVRGTVLEQLDVAPDHVHAVHIRLPSRLPEPTAEGAAVALARFGLQPGRYLLYPANFWVHKNHAMLLTALGIYRAQHPDSDLRLVCTGAPGARMDAAREAAARMGLADWTAFTGFLSDDEFAALLQRCRALIFPSLYEGFGMPPLEAMAFGKPVLCSDVTSLPEVAGDAALYFDPRKPHAIAAAIARIETEPELVATLIARGRERVAAFADTTTMAAQYLDVFRAALASRHESKLALHGVYPDGWTGERVVVTYGPSDRERYLEMALATPRWAPFPTTSAHVEHNGQNGAASYRIAQGEAVTIRCPLPPRDGFVEVLVDPVFQPNALGLNADSRTLGCICQAARLISPSGTVDLLAERIS